jgi:hypothetical protein
MTSTCEYNISDNGIGLYSIKIFIVSEKTIDKFNDDMVILIEDKLMTIFSDYYEENINNRRLSSDEYIVIVNKMLDKIKELTIYVNGEFFYSPIYYSVKVVDLARKFLNIMY